MIDIFPREELVVTLDPEEPGQWDEEEMFNLFGPGYTSKGTFVPPPAPPTSIIFVPSRPPAASPIR